MSKSNKIIAGLGVAAALGVAAMPLAGVYAGTDVTTASHDVTLQYEIDDYMELTIDDADQDKKFDVINLSDATGMKDESNTHTVEVTTNAQKGYTLSVKEKNRVKTGANVGALVNGNGGSIAGISGTAAALSAGTWGMAVTPGATAGVFPAIAQSNQTYLGVPSGNADATVTTHGAITGDAGIDAEETTVKYGVQAATTQPSGTYDIVLTYTATANS